LVRRYEGSFQANKKHGQGKLKYANGSVYEGGWKKNKKDGQGCMTYVKRRNRNHSLNLTGPRCDLLTSM